MNPMIRRLAPLGLLVSLTACESDEPGAPAVLEPASIAVSLQFPDGLSSSAGLREGYLKTNRLFVQFRDQSSTREERQVEFQPSAQESHYPLFVRLRSPRETMNFKLEVRFGDAAVFRGETPVDLRAGRLTQVNTTLIPVLAGVRAPDTVPEITAWGDTLRIGAVGILATGDTIDGVSISWTSLDPVVATITNAGTVTGLIDGTARVVAVADAFTDTAIVRVRADVANVVVTPPRTFIPLGGNFQYTVSLFDRHGNPLPTRPVTWSSSDPSIISIDAMGVARATGIGTVMIDARAGSANAAAEATGIPIAPVADSIKAVVNGLTSATLSAIITPNGAPTEGWFEWGSAQAPSLPSVLLPVPVGAGLLAIPFTAPLTNLRPNTTYYAVAHASNSAGSALSDTVWFTTGSGPTPNQPPRIVTESWTLLQPIYVALFGSAETGGVPADTWFEWGTDPLLKTATRTAVQTVNGVGSLPVTAYVQLPVPGTYYFRFVGQNANGISAGAILTMTTNAPHEPASGTSPATNITHEGATLNGTVNPNGAPTTAWFHWGTDPLLNTFTASGPVNQGAGSTPVPFSFNLSALVPNTTYYFQLNAGNNVGSSSGPILSFTTLPDPNVTPPSVTTGPPSYVFEGAVTLNGTVNPNGDATSAWFEWGSSSDPSTFAATAPQALGAGSSPMAISATFPKGTTGYYRAVAMNAGGLVYGTVVQF